MLAYALAQYYNIIIEVARQNIDIISNPLAYIVKLSLASGVAPKELKIARVIPLVKSDD